MARTTVVVAAQAPATARDTGRTMARAQGLDTYQTTAGQEGATHPTTVTETVDTDQTTTDPPRCGRSMGDSPRTRAAPGAPEDLMAPTDVLQIRAVEASPTWSRCSAAWPASPGMTRASLQWAGHTLSGAGRTPGRHSTGCLPGRTPGARDSTGGLVNPRLPTPRSPRCQQLR